ncbi:MAG TPA: TIGR01777 family oxidoreductase, partial [Fimbriimonadaceae bacterium]|nr:TIGR01777 family oxidoreductase [Fimbriimonadaceae bacterium]
MKGKIIVAGGTGSLGRLLTAAFKGAGYHVLVLSRSAGAGRVVWDGKTVGDWATELEGAIAVVNLSGQSVVKRWTPASTKAMRDARVLSTIAIADAIKACKTPPRVWINASAAGYYGDTGDREVTEASKPGNGFLAELCVEWERACLQAYTPETRKVCLRIGVVLGPGAEFIKKVGILVRIGLGSALGNGRQYVSWIHGHDLAQMALWCLQEPVSGPLNAVAPQPVTNACLMAEMRAALSRPPVPPVPAPLVRLAVGLAGMEPTLLLTG